MGMGAIKNVLGALKSKSYLDSITVTNLLGKLSEEDGKKVIKNAEDVKYINIMLNDSNIVLFFKTFMDDGRKEMRKEYKTFRDGFKKNSLKMSKYYSECDELKNQITSKNKKEKIIEKYKKLKEIRKIVSGPHKTLSEMALAKQKPDSIDKKLQDIERQIQETKQNKADYVSKTSKDVQEKIEQKQKALEEARKSLKEIEEELLKKAKAEIERAARQLQSDVAAILREFANKCHPFNKEKANTMFMALMHGKYEFGKQDKLILGYQKAVDAMKLTDKDVRKAEQKATELAKKKCKDAAALVDKGEYLGEYKKLHELNLKSVTALEKEIKKLEEEKANITCDIAIIKKLIALREKEKELQDLKDKSEKKLEGAMEHLIVGKESSNFKSYVGAYDEYVKVYGDLVNLLDQWLKTSQLLLKLLKEIDGLYNEFKSRNDIGKVDLKDITNAAQPVSLLGLVKFIGETIDKQKGDLLEKEQLFTGLKKELEKEYNPNNLSMRAKSR